MEDTLRVKAELTNNGLIVVLILVLMEDTLRGTKTKKDMKASTKVLILVLMEDTLRGMDRSVIYERYPES